MLTQLLENNFLTLQLANSPEGARVLLLLPVKAREPRDIVVYVCSSARFRNVLQLSVQPTHLLLLLCERGLELENVHAVLVFLRLEAQVTHESDLGLREPVVTWIHHLYWRWNYLNVNI